jgi:hypothetical protein
MQTTMMAEQIAQDQDRIRQLNVEIGNVRAAGVARVRQLQDENRKLREALDRILGEGGQGRLTVRDLCYTAFMRAKGKNDEDGGPTDWFNDTLPTVMKGVENLRQQIQAAGE